MSYTYRKAGLGDDAGNDQSVPERADGISTQADGMPAAKRRVTDGLDNSGECSF